MSKIESSTTARHLSRAPWVQGGLWKGCREQLAQDPFKCQSMSRPLQSCHYSDHMGTSIWPTWPPPGLPAPKESWLCHLQILVQDLTCPKPQFSQLYNGEDNIYCPGLFWRLRGNACEVLSTVPGIHWAPVPLSLFPLNLLDPWLFQTPNSYPLLEHDGVDLAIMSHFISIHLSNHTAAG